MTDQPVVTNPAKGLSSAQDKKCPGSSIILAEQRQTRESESEGAIPRRSRDAKQNSRSEREREGDGTEITQAREEGAEQEESLDDRRGEEDQRDFKSRGERQSAG